MREDLFKELVEAVIQGGKILQGKIKPSRRFVYSIDQETKEAKLISPEENIPPQPKQEE
jgi:hypothetical protein